MSLLDPDRRPWAAQVWARPLPQPDSLSCGAASLVVARALTDEAYAELLVTGTHPGTGHQLVGDMLTRFHAEVLAMHRRVTGAVDVRGSLQVPWPRRLGTPPWAVARQLGTHYRVEVVLPHARTQAYDGLRASLTRQRPVVLFVGNRWLPRHVVLAVAGRGPAVEVYDPGSGRVRELRREAFIDARLQLSRWDVPWFVVAPTH